MGSNGFSADDLGRPPGKREMVRHDREYRALCHWFESGNEASVAKEMGLPNSTAARVLINRAVARLEEDRAEHVGRTRQMHQHLLGEMVRSLAEAFRAGNMRVTKDIIAVMERQAKLDDLDARKEEASGGDTYILQQGGDINMIPKGGEVIDMRTPWQRGEILEGQVEAEA